MRSGFLFRFAVCGLFAASGVAAQQPQSPTDPNAVLTMQRNQTAQLAAAWLHSGDPRLQAWGAYVVLRDQHKKLVPDLLAIVRDHVVTAWPVTVREHEQHDAMQAVLDALIQLHAEVSASDAARLYSEFPAQILILLSRDGEDANVFLFEIFRAENSQRNAWLAAGNMLAQRNARGFALTLLTNEPMHLEISVADPIEGDWTLEPVPGHPNCSGGFTEEKSDWPQVGAYALVADDPNANLLADGADPVYYERSASVDYELVRDASCVFRGLGNTDLLREHYLVSLLHATRGKPVFDFFSYQMIFWKDGDTYLSSLRTFIEERRNAFVDMRNKLKDAGLISSAEAEKIEPHLYIWISDGRTNKKDPLPHAEDLGENVIVKM